MLDSKDIIHRWTYPMVPDANYLAGTTFTRSRQLIYKEQNVRLSRYDVPINLYYI